MPDRLVESHQDAVFLDGQPQQQCIRNLLMPEDLLAKWFDKGGPTAGNWPIAIAGALGQDGENLHCFSNGIPANAWVGSDAQVAGLGKCA